MEIKEKYGLLQDSKIFNLDRFEEEKNSFEMYFRDNVAKDKDDMEMIRNIYKMGFNLGVIASTDIVLFGTDDEDIDIVKELNSMIR